MSVRVSVIVPLSGTGDERSVRSLLEQSLGDIEVVAVGDPTRSGIASLPSDPRVRFMERGGEGIAASLNRAVASTRGEHIAFLGGGDVAAPQRLEEQAAYLDSHRPRIGVVGTGVELPNGRRISYPSGWGELMWAMHFGCAVCPSTVMMRREVFEELSGLSLRAGGAEGYDLLLRAMRITRLANLPAPLVRHVDRRTDREREAELRASMRAIEVSLGRRVDRRELEAMLRPETIRTAQEGIGAARMLIRFKKSFNHWYRKVPRLEIMAIKSDISRRLDEILVRTARVAPKGVPMILWQSSRGGPGVVYRLSKVTSGHLMELVGDGELR